MHIELQRVIKSINKDLYDLILTWLPEYSLVTKLPLEEIKEIVTEAATKYVSLLYIALINDTPAGFIVLELLADRNKANLAQAYLIKKFRRHGTIKIINEQIEGVCRDLQIKTIYFTSRKNKFGCAEKAQTYADYLWHGSELMGHMFVKHL